MHRRVFLVLPDFPISHASFQALTPGQFYSGFDLSVRYQQTGPGVYTKFMNSLQTLSLRENRTGHQVGGAFPAGGGPLVVQSFPYRLTRALLAPQGTAMTSGIDGDWGVSGVDDDGNGVQDDVSEAGWFGSDDLTQPLPGIWGETYGSDVIQSQLLAFDAKIFDPDVTVQQTLRLPPQPTVPASFESVLPGDPGYTINGTPIGQGGFVDLFYARYIAGAFAAPTPLSVSSAFAGPPQPRSGLRQPLPPLSPVTWGLTFPVAHPAVYDAWPLFYEHDGLDQDGLFQADQGTNGVDDPPFVNGVDDVTERETSPPYPVPLRGIQVRIRIIDPDSRQVRQVTVSSDFVPE